MVHLEMKNQISELKNSQHGINKRLEITKENMI